MSNKFTIIFIILILILLAFFGLYLFFRQSAKKETPIEPKIIENHMKITSQVFVNNSPIPSKYTCDGENVNPPLLIAEVPAEAVELVLIVDDPDAPAGTWVHWILWNLDPRTTEIAEGATPVGAIEGITTYSRPGYGGPCPPSGTHRYFFKLYALNQKIVVKNKQG